MPKKITQYQKELVAEGLARGWSVSKIAAQSDVPARDWIFRFRDSKEGKLLTKRISRKLLTARRRALKSSAAEEASLLAEGDRAVLELPVENLKVDAKPYLPGAWRAYSSLREIKHREQMLRDGDGYNESHVNDVESGIVKRQAKRKGGGSA